MSLIRVRGKDRVFYINPAMVCEVHQDAVSSGSPDDQLFRTLSVSLCSGATICVADSEGARKALGIMDDSQEKPWLPNDGEIEVQKIIDRKLAEDKLREKKKKGPINLSVNLGPDHVVKFLWDDDSHYDEEK